MANVVKTTILMDETIHDLLVKRYGQRRISKTVNKLLKRSLFRPKKSMYGKDPWLTMKIEEKNEHPDL